VYIGTPQTVESINNTLPGRGYTIRIWTVRYPTLDEEIEYGNNLAPFLREHMEADPSLRTGGGIMGDVGKPTDARLGEELLQAKEMDQGPSYFKLQHMLSTKLNDTARFPLHSRDLIIMHLNPEEAPGKITWQPRPEFLVPLPPGSSLQEVLYRPTIVSPEMFPYSGRMMYVDPAGGGQNGDETAACVTFFLHGYIFIMAIKGFPGGIREDVFRGLSAVAWRWQVNIIQVEKNFGNGAFAEAWRPYLNTYYEEASQGKQLVGPRIEDVWESGQKELRIIDCLEPIIARHGLIVNESVIQDDVLSTQAYPMDKRSTYQFLHQFARITRDKGALLHDDRLDAVASAVRYWVSRISQNVDKIMQEKLAQDMQAFFANPFGLRQDNRLPKTAFDKYLPYQPRR
jgi:hypothetical protein